MFFKNYKHCIMFSYLIINPPVAGEELPEDEVEEIVEEFEETLEDGTVRKVTRKRIIKRTYQMVEVDPNDPDAVQESGEGDDVHRYV